MRRMPTLLMACLLLVAAAAAARGDDWPNWRGPSGAGVAAGGGYVASWGPQENVRTDKGRVECLEAASGKTLWQGELPKNRNAYSASPVLVDGRLVVTREDGHATTLAAGDAFEVLAEGDVGEMTVAMPVFVDGGIFLRTHDALWCLGAR